MHLVSLLSPVYWTTATEVGKAANGFSVTNGHFRREVQAEFATGNDSCFTSSKNRDPVDSQYSVQFSVHFFLLCFRRNSENDAHCPWSGQEWNFEHRCDRKWGCSYPSAESEDRRLALRGGLPPNWPRYVLRQHHGFTSAQA